MVSRLATICLIAVVGCGGGPNRTSRPDGSNDVPRDAGATPAPPDAGGGVDVAPADRAAAADVAGPPDMAAAVDAVTTAADAAAAIAPLAGPVVALARWHSWDAVLQMGPPQGLIPAEGSPNPAPIPGGDGGAGADASPSPDGAARSDAAAATIMQAALRFYQLDDETALGGNPTLLDTFISGAHPEGFNMADHLWASSMTAKPYPYVGKSTYRRGAGEAETNAPQPTGVLDLAVHPPETANLVVVAFVAPTAGNYAVTDLGARRVVNMGGTTTFKVFTPGRQMVVALTAGEDRAWVTDANTYPLGALKAGDAIYFAVDKDGVFYYDSTRISFSVLLIK